MAGCDVAKPVPTSPACTALLLIEPFACRLSRLVGFINISSKPVGWPCVDARICGAHAVIPVEESGTPAASQCLAIEVDPQRLLNLPVCHEVSRDTQPRRAVRVRSRPHH